MAASSISAQHGLSYFRLRRPTSATGSGTSTNNSRLAITSNFCLDLSSVPDRFPSLRLCSQKRVLDPLLPFSGFN